MDSPSSEEAQQPLLLRDVLVLAEALASIPDSDLSDDVELTLEQQQAVDNIISVSHSLLVASHLRSAGRHTTKANLSSLELLVCGALAGAVAKTIMAPIDRVKLLYFVSPSRSLSFKSAAKTFKTIWKATGIRGLFKGNASAMWRVIPYSGLTFTTYSKSKVLLMERVKKSNIDPAYHRHIVDFCAGVGAGVLSTFFTHPLDVIRARAGAHWSLEPLYEDAMSGMAHIIRNEGIRGLYAGIFPSIVGIIPYSGISFYLFERFKSLSAYWENCHVTQISTPLRLLSGGFAAAIASGLMHPLHVVRRRMQVYGVAKDTPQYNSTMSALKDIYKKEGIRRGLFKGLLMTQMKTPIATAISFALNDTLTHHVDLAKQDVKREARELERQRQEEHVVQTADQCRRIVWEWEQNQLRRSWAEKNVNVVDKTHNSNLNNVFTYDFANNRITGLSCQEAVETVNGSNDQQSGSHATDNVCSGALLSQLNVFPDSQEQTPLINTSTLTLTSPSANIPQTSMSTDSKTLTLPSHISPWLPPCYAAYKSALASDYSPAIDSAILKTCQNQIQAAYHANPASMASLEAKLTSSDDLAVFGPHTTPLPPQPVRLSNTSLLAIGAIAGCISKTAICPADNVKIMFQVNPLKQFTLMNAVHTGATVVRERGWNALWRGNVASLVRTAPYSAITYMTYDNYCEILSKILPATESTASDAKSEHVHQSTAEKSKKSGKNQTSGLVKFIGGGLAGVTATAVTFPLDLMRVRMASSIWGSTHPYKSYFHGFQSVIHTHGWRSIYSGLGPTLIGIFPYAGTSFFVYNSLKESYHRLSDSDAPVPLQMTFGGLAALISQSMFYPLDVIRRRKQIGMLEGLSTRECFQYIWKNEGWRNFFKSLSMNWVKGPVAAGISFMSNDRMKALASTYKDTSAKSL